MRKISTLLAGLLGVALLSGATSRADLAEVKELEAKVKGVVKQNLIATVGLMATTVPASGSGVIINKDGLILTAAHVTKGSEEMIVLFNDGRQAKAKVLGSNFTRDLGLAQITDPGPWPYVEIGDSSALKITSIVVALGHPGGFDLRRPSPVRIGRITTPDAEGFLVSDCALVGGDSGGPLYDLDGKVVGIHSSIGGDLSFNRHAPVDSAIADMEKLLDGQRWGNLGGRGEDPEQPVVGLSVDKESQNGIRVTGIQPESPAEKAGFEKEDLILKVSGREVKDYEAFMGAMRRARLKEEMAIDLKRGEENVTIKLTPIARAEMLKRLSGKPEPKAEPAKPGDKPAPKEGKAWVGAEMTKGPVVRFLKLEKGSPLGEAGIKVGDTLLEVNGKPVDKPEVLTELVAASEPGKEIELKVKTWQGEKTFKIKTGSN